jgi:hypothetical protein
MMEGALARNPSSARVRADRNVVAAQGCNDAEGLLWVPLADQCC